MEQRSFVRPAYLKKPISVLGIRRFIITHISVILHIKH